MKNRIAKLFITSSLIAITVNVGYAFDSVSDYTGEAFFAPPSIEKPLQVKKEVDEFDEGESRHTVPPLKQLRLNLKERAYEKEQSLYELAPTASDLYTGEV